MNNYFISKDNKSGEIVYLEYDKEGVYIDLKQLSFEEYILFQELYDDKEYTKDSVFFRIDYGNGKFTTHLESLGLELIKID